MKKIYTLLVLSLFLVSLIPNVTAKDDTGTEKTTIKGKSEEAPGKDVSACMQRLLKAKPNLLRNKAQEICVKTLNLKKVRVLKAANLKNLTEKPAFKKFDKNLAFKARAIDKIKLEKARENFLKAKERFLNAREKYQLAQQKFLEAKSKIKECEGQETEECEQLRAEIQEHAKDNLIAIADRILEHLNKLKAKVEANEELTEEESAEIIAKIDEQIKEVEDAKSTIETSETKEDIIEAAKTLRKIWVKIKARVKLDTTRTVNTRIGGIIVKSKQLEVKLNKILEKMAEDGKDTSAIEPLINEFNTKLEEAKTHYELAVEKLKEAKSTTPPNTDLVREGQDHMKEAHKALQDAQKILRDILKTIKEAGGEEELEESEEEEEIEEEVEEEETEVEVGGEVKLSAEAQATLDELKASFAGVKSKVELKLKVKKKDGKVTVEKDKVEGTLTTEQQALWDSLKEQAIALVESAEGDDLELEIEIEHELETEEEAEEEELEEDEEETEEGEEDDETEDTEEGEETE